MSRTEHRRRRRPVAAGLAVAVLCAAACTSSAPRPTPAPPSRLPAGAGPNLVVILSDDQSPATLDPGPPAVMPKLEARLRDPRDHWIRFTNAFLNTPLCCPSRATILSGQYSHHTGVRSNLDGDRFDDSSTVATWLQAAGYRTALVGKYLNGYPFGTGNDVPPGWDHFAGWKGQGLYDRFSLNEDGRNERVGGAKADYATDVFAADAVRFIDQTADRSPFFLYLATTAPHAPWKPPPGHTNAFADAPPVRQPDFNEADVSDKPRWVRALPRLSPSAQADVDDDRLRQERATLGVDEAVDQVLRALERTGVLDRTIVVFMTDNGYAFGEHRWETKRCEYDECTRTPFLVRMPGVRPHQERRLVSNVDVAPTLADLAGIPVPAPVDGRSLVPLLSGRPPSTWRSGVLLEYAGASGPEAGEEASNSQAPKQAVPAYWAIHTADHLYVELATGERELYDLRRDPFELENLAGQAGVADVQRRLAAELAGLRTAPAVRRSG